MNHPEPSPDWSRLEPVIDSIIDELPELERRAVVLRFYEKKSHGAIGSLLGLSEEAARKRLDRALEKLRGLLAKRGIATTSGALATILPAHAIAPAPADLSASLSSTALSTAMAVTATSSTSILTAIMSHKAVSAAAALLLLAGVTAVAVPALTKDKNAPLPASASAPATTGETAPGADAGGAAAARAKSKSNASTARLTEKYGDSRTKLAGHLSTEVIGLTEDLLGILDFAGQSTLGETMFHDPAETLGAAAESITLTEEQKTKISALQAASMKRESDEARKMLEDLKKAPEMLIEALLLADALKRGEITQEEFDSAQKNLEIPKHALSLAFDEGGSNGTEDDPIFAEELLRVLDEEQGKIYQEAMAAKKAAKSPEVAMTGEKFMTLEEFEKQITSTRKIVRGAAVMMEGISDGSLLVPERAKE